jgi:hypothetical protein
MNIWSGLVWSGVLDIGVKSDNKLPSKFCLQTHNELFSRLLSKHSADAANFQKSNSVNHFNLCATIWKVRIFEGTPAIRYSGKKNRH